jgi:GNAT superfamily N-acetyltransferase
MTADDISISFPPAEASTNAALTTSLASIVNAAYAAAEVGIWKPGHKRTNPDEVASFIQKGQLVVASHRSKPIGCIVFKLISPALSNFGMLSLDEAQRDKGIGKGMVLFAEEESRRRGCDKISCELLFPTEFEHEFKGRMQKWYQKMGYEVVRVGDFAADYPEFIRYLAGPAEFRIFEKTL